jgi:hypothetical protein
MCSYVDNASFDVLFLLLVIVTEFKINITSFGNSLFEENIFQTQSKIVDYN